MGDRPRILKNRQRARLYVLIAGAFLAFLGVLILGASILGINLPGTDEPLGRVNTPQTPSESAGQAAQEEAAYIARAKQAAKEQEAAERQASERRAEDEPAPMVPADTTMYLTIPAIGLHDIPVLEGTSEAILSQGVGHVPGTGFPWVDGSNTYIAGHRLGYPGTVSDRVFYSLPNLVAGDKVILEDSLGQSYTYQVSEILEVAPTDLSVTAPTGEDIVSLQTCIENYGDYWTEGPNWLARYIVRAEQVS
jgi:LPXTG-site transpeptidase (sortase) family protein